ncbi:MAG TPA: YeeE/YedE family protein [Ramlibacter sp.]|nr:YeeE/YedE family protein [Ramlibacter sp.]
MHRLIEFFVGLLFGWGLLLSGMTDPGKVQGFLDLFGAWDPSLAFVMGGAIAVGLFAFALAKRRTTTFLGGVLHLPTARHIDKPLVVGSLIFGAGWGLAGFCPGPGIVAMAAGEVKAAVFVAAMLAGMLVYRLLDRADSGTPTARPVR